MSRSFTLDERIGTKEAMGEIDPPFSPHERDLAKAVSEAFYFAFFLREMPGRCADADGSNAAVDFAISRLLLERQRGPGGVLRQIQATANRTEEPK
jgi:hypothetical protein